MSTEKTKRNRIKESLYPIIIFSIMGSIGVWSYVHVTTDGYEYNLNNIKSSNDCLDLALAMNGGTQSSMNSLGLSSIFYSQEQKTELVNAINEKIGLCESWQNVVGEDGKRHYELLTCEQISLIMDRTTSWFEQERLEKEWISKSC